MPSFFASPFSLVKAKLRRFRADARPTVAWAIRLSVSTVAAYVAAKAVYPETSGITGALTALLVVQMTLYSIVRHGWDRILSVVLGIGVAAMLSVVTGITWWSLGIAVTVSVFAGRILRVGPNLVEIPITAMLVLGAASGSTFAARDRLIETLIGAAVGVVINLLFPPGDRSKSAGFTIEQYADDVASFLEKSADRLTEGVTADQVSDWLSRARKFDEQINYVYDTLSHADENRKLNMRAMATRDAGPALRAGLDALEHSAVALRSVFRAINDVVQFPGDSDDPFPLAERELVAAVLCDLAHTLRSFGDLVREQVYGVGAAEEAKMRVALSALSDTRNQFEQYVRMNPADNPWLQELNVFLVASIGRVIREFNVDHNGWLARKSHYDYMAMRRTPIAADKMRSKTREFALRAPVKLRKP